MPGLRSLLVTAKYGHRIVIPDLEKGPKDVPGLGGLLVTVNSKLGQRALKVEVPGKWKKGKCLI